MLGYAVSEAAPKAIAELKSFLYFGELVMLQQVWGRNWIPQLEEVCPIANSTSRTPLVSLSINTYLR